MGCQKDIAEKIQKQGGDYLFAVKGNQGRLNKAFEEKFPLKELNNPEHDSYAISEKSHGREEIRLHIVCDVPDELIDFTFEWKGLKKLCVAVSFRSIIAEQKKEPEMTVRYYISSADLTAEKFATAIRNHWHVENKLHWRLDVVMNEDDCKIRRGNAAELFSGIRHIAINILTNDKVFKAGLRRKMRKAAHGQKLSRVSPCGERAFVILPCLLTSLQALPLHYDLLGATAPFHYDVNLPSLTPCFCLHSTQTATFITSVKITCRNSHTY
ncbi:H repeat-associated protein [Escherichia coli]|uniref:H repeat-associated protein n=1 Tax=Escherichia coli TaxID=562 RepID=A0A376L055_ECOLX|nr:H repeat-associated protein [Escherichia coli]